MQREWRHHYEIIRQVPFPHFRQANIFITASSQKETDVVDAQV
jgi:hypothetical protein